MGGGGGIHSSGTGGLEQWEICAERGETYDTLRSFHAVRLRYAQFTSQRSGIRTIGILPIRTNCAERKMLKQKAADASNSKIQIVKEF